VEYYDPPLDDYEEDDFSSSSDESVESEGTRFTCQIQEIGNLSDESDEDEPVILKRHAMIKNLKAAKKPARSKAQASKQTGRRSRDSVEDLDEHDPKTCCKSESSHLAYF